MPYPRFVTSGSWSSSTSPALNMAGQPLRGPLMTGYTEVLAAAPIAANVLTLDLAVANAFSVALTQNVTSISFLHVPAASQVASLVLFVQQDATGGRTFAWPAAVKWSSGAPPALPATPNGTSVYSLITRNGGSSWFGFPAGDFA